MIKIYFSKYFDDYIFLEGDEVYGYYDWLYDGKVEQYPVLPQHLKNSRRHKDKRDKEVIFIVTVKD